MSTVEKIFKAMWGEKIKDFGHIPQSSTHYASAVKIFTFFCKHEAWIFYTKQSQHSEKL